MTVLEQHKLLPSRSNTNTYYIHVSFWGCTLLGKKNIILLYCAALENFKFHAFMNFLLLF